MTGSRPRALRLRRVGSLPPYVFATINELKLELRRAGEDVIDLGFGNPDLPSPEVAVEKLCEVAVQNPRNHRYSASRGIPNLRAAVCDLYARRFGVELDPETQALTTIGAKEGLAHLMWVLLQPGDAAVVPSPSYPIHLFAPVFAGAVDRGRRDGVGRGPVRERRGGVRARAAAPTRARSLVPAQPDDRGRRRATSCSGSSTSRASGRLFVVHDFAYADIAFDGHVPPSILQAEGADRGRRRAVHADEVVLDGRLARRLRRSATPRSSQALARLKSYLDYGTFQPIQIASIVAMNEAPDYPAEVCEIYRSRRDALCDGLARIGWHVQRPLGTMFVWAPIPEPYRALGSLEFAVKLAREARVAVSPGVGFGAGGDGHVRFALVENEHRIGQAVAGLRRGLPELAG